MKTFTKRGNCFAAVAVLAKRGHSSYIHPALLDYTIISKIKCHHTENSSNSIPFKTRSETFTVNLTEICLFEKSSFSVQLTGISWGYWGDISFTSVLCTQWHDDFVVLLGIHVQFSAWVGVNPTSRLATTVLRVKGGSRRIDRVLL